ncbi:MAG: lycopene cyclase family protein [Bacteroidota bacterium]
MSTTQYDYAIVGAGAAGLHLLFAMLEEPWFSDKSILILEKDSKTSNDRTWCYWEKGPGKWDDIVEKQWEQGHFITKQQDINFSLLPYRYKMLHSLAFYNLGKERISKAARVHWVEEEIMDMENRNDHIFIQGRKQAFRAGQVFDSRIAPTDPQILDQSIYLYQPFKGWFIRTEEPVFDPSSFVMMDYRLKMGDSTSFTYVLPTSAHEALIEFTLFTPELVDENIYDQYLTRYISEILQLDVYEITREEQGIIPMTNYPFHKSSQERIVKIGTGGSWVKPSTGYSFKNAEKMARKITRNLTAGLSPTRGMYSKKFHWYDTLFLDVLYNRNELGEGLFTSMYQKNPIQQIFSFLDQESKWIQELRIMASFDSLPFIRALGRQLAR